MGLVLNQYHTSIELYTHKLTDTEASWKIMDK